MKPTMEMINILKNELVTTSRGGILRAGIALEKAMAAAPKPEPVVWKYQPNDGLNRPAYTEREAQALAYDAAPVALYTEPPPAPITLTVWEGPMPESNGKSNFTAILMRKDATFMDGITGGITIERSEYPDRVRYEADRMRYLIGELDVEPCITDYDPDKHSGYVRKEQ